MLNGDLVDEARIASLAAELGPSERLRYRNFQRPQRAREFLLGRILLRRATCSMLGIDNEQIVVTEREAQAPLLTLSPQHDPPSFYFSLSHSRGWIACAASVSCHVGLDIEDKNSPRNIAALSAAAFTPDEMSWLGKLPEAQRVEAFYRLWNCNEALYKLLHNQGQEPQAINAGWNCRILLHARLGICLCSVREVSVVNIVELNAI
ncbi:4'-phosphopantetheinyl transferase superfamily protein [Herbaspirillum sp. 3R-11]|uniref:4'-phosphopantetheinyl transferase family protein n=1 Tax=Herbaspirillum sp. 3R-11 TaxID=2559616 RepID=UPI0010742476|nr:4'-phosphopantetheinyl transferase superfamily protein [Herbaspirillum sp. 3R-11]TFI06961.1 4'-phosphopantetheinyl transferase superfamily protein [Herbaspirillum sp. 3R11]TFI23718.1 4'-phosphopantetheinyl transferase superfamily protein [Herbaspirillum sp. 3C11]